MNDAQTTRTVRTKRRKAVQLRSDRFDDDDIALYLRKIGRVLHDIGTIAPDTRLETARLRHPGLDRFSFSKGHAGTNMRFDPTDHSRAFHISDHSLDAAPADIASLTRLLKSWRSTLRLPYHRQWPGRRTEDDGMNPHARRVCAFVSHARPGEKDLHVRIVPPSPTHAGRITITSSNGRKRMILDPRIENLLLSEMPCLAAIAEQDDRHGIVFCDQGIEIHRTVDHSLFDAIERLRVAGEIDALIGRARPMRNA